MRLINDIYKVVFCFSLFLLFVLTSCEIENDIPYPVVNAGITDIRVEGQRSVEGSSDDAAIIDTSAKSILLYVNDSVDVSNLKLTRLVVNPRDAQLLVDTSLCANPNKFPFAGFASLDSIPLSANTRMNFSKPVNFTIKTYQDYVWQVTVKQIIDRKVVAKGIIDYSIDETDNRVIIYVEKGESLKNISITSLALGGTYGMVTPDPATVKDFTSPKKFTVQYPWSGHNSGEIWTVYVRLIDGEGGSQPSTGTLSVNAWSKYALVEGKVADASSFFEYVKQGGSTWSKVSTKSDGAKASAKIEGLYPSTTYQYRLVNASGNVLSESTFTTEKATSLYNGGFEEWYGRANDNLTKTTTWFPCSKEYHERNGSTFWDSSNLGTTTGSGAVVGINPTQGNSTVVHTQGGKSAELKSQFKVKFAAASLYTGSFGELVGLDGAKINFGIPFDSRPTALHGYFQYAPAVVTHVGNNQPSGTISKGDNDICSIYIALAKKQYTVDNTKVETFINFRDDSNIIAYGEVPVRECGSTNGSWKEFTIKLDYKTQEKPANMHLIIVASASKYGDYFTGGDGSVLYVDDFELIYD